MNALEGLQFQFNVVCAYCISDNNSPLLKTTESRRAWIDLVKQVTKTRKTCKIQKPSIDGIIRIIG